ncbi:hypothetical protein RF11_13834 [Thelohanellus kitauei]|uniref:Uncharacterized protein n=1 Tax=Thelohanellus kitauei TaxID=669202 RepID=A0A0C2IAQ7_THEKT|nr:hypothetical protein RF11_13834 [Thelohanellus kitauei]
MDGVLRFANKIRSKARNRRELSELLFDMNDEYGKILRLCKERWISKGKKLPELSPVQNLVSDIVDILKNNIHDIFQIQRFPTQGFLMNNTVIFQYRETQKTVLAM